MRNVTFILQKELSRNPSFDDWYSPWRETLRNEPLLNWLNDSRVSVVHKKDLILNSSANVRIVATYDDAAREVANALGSGIGAHDESAVKTDLDFFANPESSNRKIMMEVMRRNLPNYMLEQATLTIERVWKESNLPTFELLTALSICFGIYWQMLKSAHDLCGQDVDQCSITSDSDHPIELIERDEFPFRPKCMMTTRSERSTCIRFRDGVILSSALEKDLQLTDASMRASTKRYGEPPKTRISEPNDLFSMIPYYIAQAKRIIEAGDQHKWLAFLYRGQSIELLILEAEDNADKRGLMQVVAEHCVRDAFTGIVFVGESWSAPTLVGEDGVVVAANEHPHRIEQILIHAETPDGRAETVTIPIKRNKFRKATFGLERRSEKVANFMAPVRAVWKDQQQNHS